MRSAEELLHELIAVDESHGIEAKRCRQVDRWVMESICAFSNEPGLGGGHLLLGVSRDEDAGDLFGRTYRVDGIDDPDRVQADLASQRASVFNRPVRPRVAVELLQGKPVVVVQVQEATAGDKPVPHQPGLAARRVSPRRQHRPRGHRRRPDRVVCRPPAEYVRWHRAARCRARRHR